MAATWQQEEGRQEESAEDTKRVLCLPRLAVVTIVLALAVAVGLVTWHIVQHTDSGGEEGGPNGDPQVALNPTAASTHVTKTPTQIPPQPSPVTHAPTDATPQTSPLTHAPTETSSTPTAAATRVTDTPTQISPHPSPAPTDAPPQTSVPTHAPTETLSTLTVASTNVTNTPTQQPLHPSATTHAPAGTPPLTSPLTHAPTQTPAQQVTTAPTRSPTAAPTGGPTEESLPSPSPSPVASTRPPPTVGESCGDVEPCAMATYAQAPFGDVLLMRHALAPGGGDPAQFALRDCSTQRNLDSEGRLQATTVGQRLAAMFGAAGVAMNAVVYTSQWCRCIETARLIVEALNEAGLHATLLEEGADGAPPGDEGSNFGAQEEWGLNSFYQPQLGGFDREQCVARLNDVLLASLRAGRRFHGGKLVQTLLVTHYVTVSAITGRTVSSGSMVAFDSHSKDARELSLD